MKNLSFLFMGVLAFSPLVFAQNNNPRPNPDSEEPLQEKDKDNDKETRNGFWEANLAGGNYMVALGRISSVSRHRYVLDGTVIVDEVTIDTEGQALARFYFLSPIKAEALAQRRQMRWKGRRRYSMARCGGQVWMSKTW